MLAGIFRILKVKASVSNSWYYSDFQYRVEHNITGSSAGNVTDYQMKLVIVNGSGTSSGDTYYTTNIAQSDFDDIRFTWYNYTSEQEEPIDYWVETVNSGENVTVWIEIPFISNVTDNTIYVYYGNSTTTTAHDNLELDLWQLREYDKSSSYDPDMTFNKPTDSVLRLDSYTNGKESIGRAYAFIHAKKDYLDGKKLRIYWRVYYSYSQVKYGLGKVYVVDNPHLRTKTTDEFKDNDDVEHPIEDYENIALLSIDSSGTAGWTDWTTSTSSVIDLSNFTSSYVTILIRLVDGWVSQTVMLDVDYLQILDSSDNVLKTFHFTESVVMEQTGTLRDYGLYRTYVDPEPSHGDWGAEETQVTGEEYKVDLTLTLFDTTWGNKESGSFEGETGDSNTYISYRLRGSNFTAPANGEVTSITALVKCTSTSYVGFAIYDAETEQLLGQTPKTALEPSTTWLTLDLNNPVKVQGGKQYILTALGDGSMQLAGTSKANAGISQYKNFVYLFVDTFNNSLVTENVELVGDSPYLNNDTSNKVWFKNVGKVAWFTFEDLESYMEIDISDDAVLYAEIVWNSKTNQQLQFMDSNGLMNVTFDGVVDDGQWNWYSEVLTKVDSRGEVNNLDLLINCTLWENNPQVRRVYLNVTWMPNICLGFPAILQAETVNYEYSIYANLKVEQRIDLDTSFHTQPAYQPQISTSTQIQWVATLTPSIPLTSTLDLQNPTSFSQTFQMQVYEFYYNCVKNGGFETGDFTHWNQEGSYDAVIRTDWSHSGNYCAASAYDSENKEYLPFTITQKLPAVKGSEVLEVSVWTSYVQDTYLEVNYTDGSVSAVQLSAHTKVTLTLEPEKTVDYIKISRKSRGTEITKIDDVTFICKNKAYLQWDAKLAFQNPISSQINLPSIVWNAILNIQHGITNTYDNLVKFITSFSTDLETYAMKYQVRNPSFETGDFTYWNQEGDYPAVIRTDWSHTGDYCAASKYDSVNKEYLPFKITQRIDAPASYIKEIHVYTDWTQYTYLGVNYTDGTEQWIQLASFSKNTLTPDSTKTISFVMVMRNQSGGTITKFDDVEIVMADFQADPLVSFGVNLQHSVSETFDMVGKWTANLLFGHQPQVSLTSTSQTQFTLTLQSPSTPMLDTVLASAFGIEPSLPIDAIIEPKPKTEFHLSFTQQFPFSITLPKVFWKPAPKYGSPSTTIYTPYAVLMLASVGIDIQTLNYLVMNQMVLRPKIMVINTASKPQDITVHWRIEGVGVNREGNLTVSLMPGEREEVELLVTVPVITLEQPLVTKRYTLTVWFEYPTVYGQKEVTEEMSIPISVDASYELIRMFLLLILGIVVVWLILKVFHWFTEHYEVVIEK